MLSSNLICNGLVSEFSHLQSSSSDSYKMVPKSPLGLPFHFWKFEVPRNYHYLEQLMNALAVTTVVEPIVQSTLHLFLVGFPPVTFPSISHYQQISN